MIERYLSTVPSFLCIFEAIPSPSFIVDPDVRIMERNVMASSLVGRDRETWFQKRGGEAFGCIHSTETPDGCGHAPACRECVIRNAVNDAVRGQKTARKRSMAEVVSGNGITQIHLLVTASRISQAEDPLLLLILEDISELVRTQAILPICAWCKKIRNDANYWLSVEEYFKRHENIWFSHSICNECRERALKSE